MYFSSFSTDIPSDYKYPDKFITTTPGFSMTREYMNINTTARQCSIIKYFKDNPDKKSVMLVCQCPLCVPRC